MKYFESCIIDWRSWPVEAELMRTEQGDEAATDQGKLSAENIHAHIPRTQNYILNI